jgi:hypothetical protein
MQDPISKIARVKRTGRVAQVVEHLPSKCEALNSNPSTAKRKKERKKNRNVKRVLFGDG